jgi:hypothetical protein
VANYGLNPFAKEIYVMRNKHGQVCTIVGVDGWVKIVNRVPHFDGFEQIEEWSEDRKELVCVETRIHSKTRRFPAIYRGYAKEYMSVGGFVKDAMPWHMLRLFSLRHACRLFTPIGGSVVTEEEARWMERFDPTPKTRGVAEIESSLLGDVVKETEATMAQEESEEPPPAGPTIDDAFAHCTDAPAVLETSYDITGKWPAAEVDAAANRALERIKNQ